jgi:outer membrane receptor protein involved in Fe transport
MTLVAGVFDVQKPYFNLDPARVYRELGDVRHRGVELSLSGRPIKGLNVVAGAVLLDGKVSGELVEAGRIGPRPVGLTERRILMNLDYQHRAAADPRRGAVHPGRPHHARPRRTLAVPVRGRAGGGAAAGAERHRQPGL